MAANRTVKIDVTTWVSNLAINKESKNIVKIYQGVKTEEDIGKKIALQVKHSFANDVSLREPVFVTVNVKYIYERRMILPPAVSVPRGAPADVLQRLVEEQIVESTCSICIENLSGNIIRMPRCLHMFHQDCLFEWLGHQNSCPLCRIVPYKAETQTSA
ncbi:PREDICTED: E3 ubiquitin-protein ligase SGR9, amyloplastic-like [Camelina sativa]|uniref:E3 ubiquitin-protein ligase SGR9, amyloplastic-like n=1 Tax=Camelina sativa TaxID=90675 RepID=A0ABM0USJ8_CAMSA|nr:PREDICTED: E3 ubiquitin-protein ligase SGR9, amyloplastic-like [Camelina sativa]